MEVYVDVELMQESIEVVRLIHMHTHTRIVTIIH